MGGRAGGADRNGRLSLSTTGRPVHAVASLIGDNVAPVSRWIDLEGAANARVVLPGVLLRSDNPRAVTDADVRVLVEQHRLGLVVDLRSDVEVARDGEGRLAAEVRHEHRSLFPDRGPDQALDVGTLWPAGATTDVVRKTDFVRAYRGYLRRRPDSVVGAVRSIARTEGSVLVHCAAGKDRTGVIVALVLEVGGAGRGVIEADYLATRERMPGIFALMRRSDTYRDQIEGEDPEAHAPSPGIITRFLDGLDEEFGGAAAWLRGQGLSPDDIDALRARVSGATATARC